MRYYGALEAGGTKMVAAVFDETGAIVEREKFPTRTPAETMPELIGYFQKFSLTSIGVASFGPVDLNPASPTYGYITATPKLAWRNYPIRTEFLKALNVPVGFDTDVNAAALAEATLGAGKGLENCIYVTVGTGIGGGVIIHGRPVHGLIHSEIGHIPVQVAPDDPMPQGNCPYHGPCMEGMAAGPAIEKRWGVHARELPPEHPAWALESDYLAQLCANAMYTFSPEIIILGGGVMQQAFLFPLIRQKTVSKLNGYLCHPAIDNGLTDYIVPPGLGTESGITGAYLLAREAGKPSEG